MILVKKLMLFNVLCLSKIHREKVFPHILDKKKPSNTIKITVYEKRKIRIFRKGLVHRFGQKFEISSTLIFHEKIDQEKVSGNVLVRKKVSIILCSPL